MNLRGIQNCKASSTHKLAAESSQCALCRIHAPHRGNRTCVPITLTFLAQILICIALSTFSPGVRAQDPVATGLSKTEAESVPSAIHATRLDYSEFEVPEAVTVITQDDIRLGGYLEVSEIFRSVPGFRIVKIGDESRLSYHGTAVIQTRRMLITIDGHSVLIGDGQYVEFDRLPIDLEDIARVTVTRGPNGAAYGDNAFLAHIDFQTIGRNDPRGVSIRAGGGYNGRQKFGASVNQEVRGFDLTFSAAAERDGGYDYYDSAGTPRDDNKEIKRASLTLEREFKKGSRWRLDTSAYDSENITGIRVLSLSGPQHNKGEFIALSNERELGEASRLDAFVSHNRQRESQRLFGCYTAEAIATASAFITDPEDLAGILAPTLYVPALLGTSLENTCFFEDLGIASERTELEVEFESRQGPMRYLLGGSATQIDASSAQYFAGQDQRQRSYRAFGETSISLGTVHASLGAMVQDSSNVENVQAAWRGAVNWRVRPNQTLRYSYAKGFRIPSLVETETLWTGAIFFGRRGEPTSTYQFSLPLPLITNATDVQPESIESHAIGYFGTFFSSGATIDVKVFQEKIRDPIYANVFYFSQPPFNSDPYTLSGVEMEFALRLNDRWKVTGQHSYLDTDATNSFERGLYGRHAGSLAATYRPADRHALTLAYYGNSTISGNSYDRYDLVYNYSRHFGERLLRLQLIFNHHIGGVDGLRENDPFLSNEGYFAHLNQVFLYLELTF